MKIKKRYKIITFDTTSEAMEAESRFIANGVRGRIIPLPGEISAGCGLAWRMEEQDFNEDFEKETVKYDHIYDLMM